jgi:tetratricopeptide (TPR) repeat protein
MLGALKQFKFDGLKQHLQALTAGGGSDQFEGERLLDKGDYAGAELSLAKALLYSEQRRLPNDLRIQIRLELAMSQRRQFRPDSGGAPQPEKLRASEDTARSALELARREGNKAILIQCLDELSQTLGERGDLEGVEALIRETIEIEQHVQRPDALMIAKRLYRLATLRRQAGHVSDAVLPLEEALATFERLHGQDHREIGDLLTELGDSYRFLGQHAVAQKHLLRAMRIHERECGLGSPEAVHDLNLLTGSYESCGDLQSAAAQHERVLSMKLRGVGADLEQIAEAQSALAQSHVRWGNQSRARELLMEAIGTFKRRKGARLASAYEALAAVEEKAGRLQDALLQLNHAAVVWDSLQTPHTQELARNLEAQAHILERLHRSEDAGFVRSRLAAALRAAKWAEAV